MNFFQILQFWKKKFSGNIPDQVDAPLAMLQ